MENEVKIEQPVNNQVGVQPVQPMSQPVAPQVVAKEVKSKKKGRGPLYWIIVVIGVAFIVYMSIGIGEKLAKIVDPDTNTSSNKEEVDSSSNEESNKNEENDTVKELDKAEVKKYVDGYKWLFKEMSAKGLTDEIKIEAAFRSLSADITEVETSYKCADAFDDCNSTDGHRPKGDERYALAPNDPIYIYKYDTVNKQYQKLFGTKNNVPKSNYMPFEYSSKLNAWVRVQAQFGGACIGAHEGINYIIDSAKEENGKMVITVVYLENTINYQNDDCGTGVITGYSYTISGTKGTVKTESELTNVITTNKDKLSHLTFTFEKDKDNYVLTTVSK